MRSRYLKLLFCTSLLLGMVCVLSPELRNQPGNKVNIIQLQDDTINPVTAEYIVKAIDKSVEEKAQCLIIKLDTPGGLLSSTRLIVKKILTAQVPVVVYIAPSGSRAGSAGVFITYASHIAAMAPSTNIGAAHPVQMGRDAPKRQNDWRELRDLIEELKEETETEEEAQESAEEKEPGPDESPMESKILNDTVAFIRGIAKARGRNIEWAEQSVVESASITNEEALEKGVIEIVAHDEEDLLKLINGRSVTIDGKEVVLDTRDAFIEHVEMDARQNFFNILANPNIAYFLMILGFYGLLYEITNPGFGVPGVMGAIFLILAFYSMQTLPTNYAGLALMILGIILLIAEAYTPTFGLLTLGGLVCLILGSLLLFESADPIMRVSLSAIFTFSATTVVITIFLLRAVLKTQRSRVMSGEEGIIGEIGTARSDLNKGEKGKVFVHGELWNATSDLPITKGDPIKVLEIKGLSLKVGPANEEE